jgi:MFS family permease
MQLARRVADATTSLVEAFRVPGLRRVETAWALTVTGDWVSTIALAVYAFEVGGALGVGVLGLVRMVPAAVAAPILAMPGDRHARERVMTLVTLARAALIAGSAAAVWFDWPVVVVYVLVALAAIVSSAIHSTQYALLPLLARTPRELVAANVGLATIEGLGTLVGPAIAAVSLAFTGPALLLLLAAIAFGGATWLLSRVHSGAGFTPAEAPHRPGPLAEALAGFRALARLPNPRLVVALFTMQTIVRGLMGVLIVVASFDLLGLGESGVGLLSAAIGLGGLIGGVVTLMLVGRPHLALPFAFGLLAWGVPVALLGVTSVPLVAMALMMVLGLGNSLGDVAGRTTLQRSVPDAVMTRVLGVLDSLVLAAVGVGGILAPALVAAVGNRGALLATGALLPISVALAWPALRRIDAETIVPEHELSVLRAIPIFAPLDIPTIDHLAQQLRARLAPAGTVIVRQGDVGDRFYVIDRGSVEVLADGAVVAMLGAGDYFGEIALLRDVPRTATVRATEETRLLTLERDQFLAAVTGYSWSLLEADRVSTERLNELMRERPVDEP